ncbi:hypothetical protein [Salinicoccus roseus]|uniref:hypothetical protein n=1 Tax=Salinicoccus roseus TaxID=45670 RepID=UPI003D2D47BF
MASLLNGITAFFSGLHSISFLNTVKFNSVSLSNSISGIFRPPVLFIFCWSGNIIDK